MTEPQRVVIGVNKIEPSQRDVAGPVLADARAAYRDVIGSSDQDGTPVGAPAVYRAYLTTTEIERFRAASNCRYVEVDESLEVDPWVLAGADATDTDSPPGSAELEWMRADRNPEAHGRDQPVAVLDGGTTYAVRERMGWTVTAETNLTDNSPGSDEITTSHGCMVAPLAVPSGGQLIDGIIANDEGSAYWSDVARGIRWAVDQGAQVIVLSYSGSRGGFTLVDAVEYMSARGAVLVASAGNHGGVIYYPAAYCTSHQAVVSSGATDHRDDRLAEFSARGPDLRGVAPGVRVLSVNPEAVLVRVSGTSFSAPHMAGLIARCMSVGASPQAAITELRRGAFDVDGYDAWDLEVAVRELTPEPEPEPEPAPQPTPQPEPTPEPEPPKVTWWQLLLRWWRRQ